MAPRSTWKGFLRLSLVSLPVKAYVANSSESNAIRFNQLHAACNSRIKYKKTCPIHQEVTQSDIVSGYEYAKGQYVIVDPDELSKLRTEDDKAISIDTFVPATTIDPIYYSGKTYYLVPDGPVGQKPFALLHQGMVNEKKVAIAQVVLSNRKHLVLVRPVDRLLAMTVLAYEHQITKPGVLDDEVVATESSSEEMKLVRTLINETTAKKFDYSKYKDTYREELTKLIESKIAGQEIVAPPATEQPQVINLMDALRESVARVTKATPDLEEKPPRKMAPSTRTRTKAVQQKKTS